MQKPVEVAVEQTISSASEEEEQLKSSDTTASETEDQAAEDHELYQLNISLGSIDETPVRKRRFQSLQYSQNKLQKVDSAVRKRLELISGADLIWCATSRSYD